MALVLLTLPLFAISRASAVLPTPGVIPNIHQYRVASIDLPPSLDPGWVYDTTSGELMMQVYEPLIAYDHESVDAFVPVLAKSLPKVEKVTETLTTTEAVDKSNPVCTFWQCDGATHHLFGWQDKDESGGLTVDDVVWFENLADHEFSFHGVVKSITGDPTLEVERVRICFELRTGVKFHPWTSDIPGYEAHTADLLTTEDVEFSFERNCVLDSIYSPMGLVMLHTMGITTTREYNLSSVENQTLVGHMIDNAFAHNATHFWFNLVQTYGPFMQIITQYWCSIMNKAWIIALQEKYISDPAKRWYGWGSPPDYTNWIGYTDPAKPDEIDAAPGHMCGTGPYKFDYLIKDRWQIKKFDGYWQGWPAEGRSPDDYIDIVTEFDYSSDPTRAFPDFYAGLFDSVYVPREFRDEVMAHEGVRTWTGMPRLEVTAIMMGYDPLETSPYLPEMPPGTPRHDFFGDIHIRRAFAHLVNHTEYIQAAFDGEAIWPNSIVIDGLRYHNPDQEFHQYDLNEALKEFKLAFGGTEENPGPAYTQGFKVKLIYVLGNVIQQKYCEMLGEDLEVKMAGMWPPGVNVNCVAVQGLDPFYHFVAVMGSQLAEWAVAVKTLGPFRQSDADNFASYMLTYADLALFQRVQYGQSGMKQMAWDLSPWGLGAFGDPAQAINNTYVDTLIDKAVLIDDSTTAGYNMREAMYYHLQEIYYQEVPSIPEYQPTGRRWEREWVQGWYYNPISPRYEGPMGYCYHMWKGWVCNGDLDFRKDTENGDPALNYLTCDFLDLFKFRGYYLMPTYVLGHRMRMADYDCNNVINFLDLFRFRNYYVNYGQWALCEGMCHWHWPTPP